MRHDERAAARRQIDKRLALLGNPEEMARPRRGWVKAIREALGMTTAQLAARIGVSQPRAVAIEQAEASGAITLESLERAARALDCQLVYVLVPRKSLEDLVEERALELARRRLWTASHSMALEDQRVDLTDQADQLRRHAMKLIETAGSKLWEAE